VTPRLRARLELVRLPNTFTAAADVIAGWLIAGGEWPAGSRAALLALASACLYGGGAALNDWRDASADAAQRRNRPIPSGRVSRHEAGVLAAALLSVGVALAAGAGGRPGAISLALVAAIVLYDVILKRTPVAPGFMGVCRGLNLLMGLSLGPSFTPTLAAAPVGLMWLYVTALTLFARREGVESRRRELIAGGIGVVAAVLAVGALPFLGWGGRAGAAGAAVILAGCLALRAGAAVRRPSPATVQRAVTSLVLGIVLLDACLVWAALGPADAIVVAAFLLPAMGLARAFKVT
jgi:4-hydroxybenzoate polyprenyltransferase